VYNLKIDEDKKCHKIIKLGSMFADYDRCGVVTKINLE